MITGRFLVASRKKKDQVIRENPASRAAAGAAKNPLWQLAL